MLNLKTKSCAYLDQLSHNKNTASDMLISRGSGCIQLLLEISLRFNLLIIK